MVDTYGPSILIKNFKSLMMLRIVEKASNILRDRYSPYNNKEREEQAATQDHFKKGETDLHFMQAPTVIAVQ